MTASRAERVFLLEEADLVRIVAAPSGMGVAAVRPQLQGLRLRLFGHNGAPDGIVRGHLDLARTLAMSVAFELNALTLPRLSSAAMVERCWPEICRAALMAAAQTGIAARPVAAPTDASGIITFLPDSFASGATAEVIAARVDDRAAYATSSIRLDIRPLVIAVAEAGGAARMDALKDAFAELARAFGWHSGEVGGAHAQERVERTFLGDGPFFSRAEALLVGLWRSPRVSASGRSMQRQQALLDYVVSPAPVDAWKGHLGDDPRGPRLRHLLQAFGAAQGLVSAEPDVLQTAAAGDDVGDRALALIRAARSKGW